MPSSTLSMPFPRSVVAAHGGALAFRAMGACRHIAIGRWPAVRRWVLAVLAAALAGCSVKLPSPPHVPHHPSLLHCHPHHIRCLHIIGTNRSAQKRCAGYLGECYEGSCKTPARPGPHETGPNQPNSPEEQPVVDSPPTGGEIDEEGVNNKSPATRAWGPRTASGPPAPPHPP